MTTEEVKDSTKFSSNDLLGTLLTYERSLRMNKTRIARSCKKIGVLNPTKIIHDSEDLAEEKKKLLVTTWCDEDSSSSKSNEARKRWFTTT